MIAAERLTDLDSIMQKGKNKMYIIQEQGKIILADEDLQRLEDTLKFMPQYDKRNIEEILEASIVKAYDGNLYLSGYAPEKPLPTYEEVRQTREALYRDQKDPITCQIQSLRDEEETEEILAEIEALKVKRAEIVAKIKEENPYPTEESY